MILFYTFLYKGRKLLHQGKKLWRAEDKIHLHGSLVTEMKTLRKFNPSDPVWPRAQRREGEQSYLPAAHRWQTICSRPCTRRGYWCQKAQKNINRELMPLANSSAFQRFSSLFYIFSGIKLITRYHAMKTSLDFIIHVPAWWASDRLDVPCS